MLASFLLFCLRINHERYTSHRGLIYPADFGFLENGEYSITVHESSCRLVFGLFSPDEFERRNEAHVTPGYESLADIQQVYTNESISIAGVIPATHVYTLFSCVHVCTSVQFTMSVDFSNPSSRLDSRAMPSLIELPIAIAAFCLLLLFWFVNWFLNRDLRVRVHYCLTVTFSIGLIVRVLFFANLKHTEASDTSIGLQLVAVSFQVLFLVCSYTVLILCALGWCIVRESIQIVELARALILVASVVVCQTVLALVTLPDWLRICLSVLFIVSYALYGREFWRAIDLTKLYVMAYCLEIYNAGIDPLTTPVWPKYRLLWRLQYCVMVYLAALVVPSVVGMIRADLLAWVTRLLQDLADFIIVVGFALLYRLRGGNRDGFPLGGESDGELYTALSTSDPAEAPDGFQAGGIRWMRGLILPPPPGTRTNTIISLEAPDGVFQISARLDRRDAEDPAFVSP
jgi:hypothetical protein